MEILMLKDKEGRASGRFPARLPSVYASQNSDLCEITSGSKQQPAIIYTDRWCTLLTTIVQAGIFHQCFNGDMLH